MPASEPRHPSGPKDRLDSLLGMRGAWSQGQKPHGYSLENKSDSDRSQGQAGGAVSAEGLYPP